jgi:hypothetical protein
MSEIDYRQELELIGIGMKDDANWLLSYTRVTTNLSELLRVAKVVEGALTNSLLDMSQLIREMKGLVSDE